MTSIEREIQTMTQAIKMALWLPGGADMEMAKTLFSKRVLLGERPTRLWPPAKAMKAQGTMLSICWRHEGARLVATLTGIYTESKINFAVTYGCQKFPVL